MPTSNPRIAPALLAGLALSAVAALGACTELTEDCKKVSTPICEMCGADSDACKNLIRSLKLNPKQCEDPHMAESVELAVKITAEDAELRSMTCDEFAAQ